MNTNSVRGRGAAALVASAALVAGAASITTSPAVSAEAAGDCATPFPVADVARDDAVTTLTVVQGTEPVEFSGKILGVIDDGIAPGLDMVMADFATATGDTEIDKAGIWQGMSGSPVYAEDGRLIGAVAYGLAWGPSTVAGITPYEDMDDYLDTAAANRTVQVGDRAARAIASGSDVNRAQASEGFRQLPMPMGLSGVSPERLKQMKKQGPESLNLRGTRAMVASTSAAASGAEDLVAGGNLGAAISYGDITAGGVGTVTSVCDDSLIGFGHPMTWGGPTSLGMMPADAVYIQRDPVGPGFKVANMGMPAGTIDQDRLTGISGTLGVLPPETDVTSTVTFGTRSRTGSSASLVPEYNADVTFSQILANHDRVVDAVMPGSEAASFTLTGTDAQGDAFEIAFADRYTSSWDISFDAIWDIADMVYNLSSMKGVTVESITATADVTESTAVYRVKELQQKRGGSWVDIGRRQEAVVNAGDTLVIRALIAGGGTSHWIPMSFEIPADARRGGFLGVTGGSNVWDRAIYRADTPAALEEAVAEMVMNDQVYGELSLYQGRRGRSIEATSASQDLVVKGRSWAEVKVRR